MFKRFAILLQQASNPFAALGVSRRALRLMMNISEFSEEDDPFSALKLSSWEPLKRVTGRSKCPKCGGSRMFYCSSCLVLVDLDRKDVPTVPLPTHVQIIQHPIEMCGKSTCAHAGVLAPSDVTVTPFDRPKRSSPGPLPAFPDPSRTVLLYPHENAMTVDELVQNLLSKCPSHADGKEGGRGGGGGEGGCEMEEGREGRAPSDSSELKQPQEESPFHLAWRGLERVVFIDSTWETAKHILRDEQVKSLPCVKLSNAKTHFWRPQNTGAHCLATIEAIYYFFKEMDTCITQTPYRGQFDDLLYFFVYQYHTVRKAMKERPRRPLT